MSTPLPELSADKAEGLADLLACLMNPSRLKLLCILVDGECSFRELIEYTGISQSSVSQQLKKLSSWGLIERRVEGRRSYYRCTKTSVLNFLEKLEHHALSLE